MSRFRGSSRLLVVLVGTLVAFLVAGTVVLGATLQRNGGNVAAMHTATSDGDAYLFSEMWAKVPGMSVSLSVPSHQKALLLITFSAESTCTNAAPDARCYVRAVVDGTERPPGWVEFDAAHGRPPKVRSMQWVAPVGAGTHKVEIEYMINNITDEVNSLFILGERTMSVLRSRR